MKNNSKQVVESKLENILQKRDYVFSALEDKFYIPHVPRF